MLQLSTLETIPSLVVQRIELRIDAGYASVNRFTLVKMPALSENGWQE
jgi:hypothetical protein